jgi:putative hydrolase
VGVEREQVVDGGAVFAPAAAVLAVPSGALDLRVDGHVHTGFASGRDSVGVIVMAADRAGLTAVTFADQVGPDTAWLPAYADAVRRAQQRTELVLRVSAEVEVIQPDGWLAWPADLGDLEAVSVAVSRLPMSDGSYGTRDVRAMLASGLLSPTRLAEIVVEVTIRGIERASRYAPTQLARPLSLLTRVGVDDDDLPPELVSRLAEACVATGTVVELSEAWRSPSPLTVGVLRAAGVSMVAASDARYAAEVGRWQYLRGL